MPQVEGAEAPQYSPENTQLKIGGRLYTRTGMGIAIALDAGTGREDWRYDPGVSPDAIPYGATCRGIAFSLVAIDATTGEPALALPDRALRRLGYDLASQVTLVDLPTENGDVPALILPSKEGQIYVLNRETGEPLFPVEEHEVPQTASSRSGCRRHSPIRPAPASTSRTSPIARCGG